MNLHRDNKTVTKLCGPHTVHIPVKRFGREIPDGRVPVANLPGHQVVQQGPRVLGIAGDEHADLEVGIGPLPHREIVGRRQDVNTVREGALNA